MTSVFSELDFFGLLHSEETFIYFLTFCEMFLCAFPPSMFSSVTSLSAAAHIKRHDKKTSGSQLTCNVQIDGVTWRSQML